MSIEVTVLSWGREVIGLVQEGLSHAKKSGDDKKLQMVASRKKKLEDRLGMEKNAKGHRLKVQR